MSAKITKLGKYTLAEQLGSGGFGTVYKATDSIGRNVAVKVLKPGWNDDPAAIDRFRREAQVAGELFHNRIATIIDFDEAEGRLFLVMRYIDGISLDKLIKEKGHIPWAQTMQILEQVAEGLDYAHQHGFIHRDIKPANILISEKEGAVLTDFGLVKAAVASGMSTTGAAIGTPQYIAPELWEGKPITHATDIYSLACVACEMLTGDALFAGVSPPEIMTKHMQSAPPLPQSWPQGVPAGVGAVLQQALQRDPEKRYSTAAAFVLDLKKQEASLRQEIEAQAQAHITAAETLIASGNFSDADEKLSLAASLSPDLPAIGDATKKLEDARQLNQLYQQAIEYYQLAQDKAKNILKVNSDYPDPKDIFQKLGLRDTPMPAVMKKINAVQPQPQTTDLRWQEKTMPFLLILLGLATTVMWGTGLIGVVAGVGLFWRKNWARNMGMFFAALLEAAGFAVVFSIIGVMAAGSSIGISGAMVLFVACLAILLALYIINILGGQRLVNWAGITLTRPSGIWIIFVAYLVSIVGIVPAILLLVRKPAMRVWAQVHAVFLMFALPILGIGLAAGMTIYDYYDNSYSRNYAGMFLTGLIAIFFFILCIQAFRYLRKPEIRAYYENKDGNP